MTLPLSDGRRRASLLMTTAATALLAVPLLGAALPAAPAAAAPRTTCHGQDVTIVGEPGATVRGTPGDDVILSHGASRVLAGAGADLVCLSAGPARVDLGDADDVALGQPPSHDEVYVLSGKDPYDITSGAPGMTDENDDVVEQGSYGTTVVHGVPTGSFSAGSSIHFVSATPLPWVWRQQSLRVGGHPVASLYAGTGEVFLNRARWTSLTVVQRYGQRLHLEHDARPDADRPVTIRWRVGDDNLVKLQHGQSADIRTGGGFYGDAVEIVPRSGGRPTGRLVGDADGVLTEPDGATVRLQGVEDVTVRGYARVQLHGGRANDHLLVVGCGSTLWGHQGNDALHLKRHRLCRGSGGLVGYGGGGDDRLVGAGGPDRLYGGPGRDLAVGHGGRDLCRAETRRSCER
ncbi:MAG: hypothetical protein CMH83_09005 [Nocardioides sp.]|nr:hypothetical protein [Nocardioides sp.]